MPSKQSAPQKNRQKKRIAFSAKKHSFENRSEMGHFRLKKNFSHRNTSGSSAAGNCFFPSTLTQSPTSTLTQSPTSTLTQSPILSSDNTAQTILSTTEDSQQNNTSLSARHNGLLATFIGELSISEEIRPIAFSTVSDDELEQLSATFTQFNPVPDNVAELEQLRQRSLRFQLRQEQLRFFSSRNEQDRSFYLLQPPYLKL